MKAEEKAIALSYILCKLLNENLEVVLHEMKVSKSEDAGKMQHRIEKLRGATNNAFGILERNISDGDGANELKQDLETLLEEIWN